MRCLVIGSSMSLPTDELKFEDTWMYLLSKHYPHLNIIEKCKRSSSARRLTTEGPNASGKDTLEYYNPDFVITQIGATDAAPRLFKREALMTHIINHLPISKFIYNVARKTRGRVLANCDLSPELFKEQFNTYAKRAATIGTKVFIIEICKVTDKVIKVSPHYNECVEIFNSKLREVADENDNVTIIPSIRVEEIADFQHDGIHHTASGQLKMFKNILNAVSPLISEIDNIPNIKSE